jgi:diguanylate cyclase (GGDEF)-like protein
LQTYLDIRTLSFTTGIICFIVFLSMLFVQGTRQTYPGFQMWTIASFFGFFGFVLLSLQGFFSDFLTIIAANTLLIGSAIIMAHGLEVFAGKSPKLWPYIALLVLMIVLLVYFTYFSPNVMARVITISSLYILILGVSALLVYRDIPLLLQSSNWLLVMIFSSLACLNVLRSVGTMLFEFDTKNFLAPSVIQGLTFMIALSGTILIYVGLIILNSQRVERDLLVAIDQRKKAEEALKTLSLKDDLTNLYNRRGFFILAEQALKTAQRMGKEMLLIYGDLDNLKGINDTFGHREGDQALVDTSQILKETFRESDIIARIGGDEFVILAMNNLETSAEKVINRFKQVLNDHHFETKRPYRISMSLGIACFDPQNPCSVDVLLAQADKFMYSNKQKKS